jgi:NAD(P)-dependent dehydrogenase (short-subunit alcohol dehydrogenase family)
MTGETGASDTGHQPDLLGQTVVVISGSSGIGLETAHLARVNGAEVILAARSPARLKLAADEVDTSRTEAFDVTDRTRFEQFFGDLPGPVDHVMVTGGGPYYSALADMDFDEVRRDITHRVLVTLAVARYGTARMRQRGTLLFMGGTGGGYAGLGLSLLSAMTAALPALIANLALELAPIRANLIAAGFVDTRLWPERLRQPARRHDRPGARCAVPSGAPRAGRRGAIPYRHGNGRDPACALPL